MKFLPDVRVTPQILAEAWSDCIRCDLGTNRKNLGGEMVFGEGTPGGIMLIGDAPNEDDSKEGRPFTTGPVADLLNSLMDKIGMKEFVYMTNLVACRSFSIQTDANGQPIYRVNRKTGNTYAMTKDEIPPQSCLVACSPRLYQEIYAVDPVLIVALGPMPAEFLLRRPIAITTERGIPHTIEIHGASHRASLTEKRKAWIRGKDENGKFIAPVKQNLVQYIMIPTVQPLLAVRKLDDNGDSALYKKLHEDLQAAFMTYLTYMEETR